MTLRISIDGINEISHLNDQIENIPLNLWNWEYPFNWMNDILSSINTFENTPLTDWIKNTPLID